MKVQEVLRSGGVVELEGCRFVIDGDGRPRTKGDWYIAERNVGPQLLTVKSFSKWFPEWPSENSYSTIRENLSEGEYASWINPLESAYAYDYGECVKVKEVS